MSASRLLVPAVVALALALGGCEVRPRSNPLDPLNPSTGGGPVSFRALGGNNGIHLRWNPAPARADLLGLRLERRRAGPDPFVPLGGILPLNSTGYDDGVARDLDFEYRLSFVARDSTTSGLPAVATARAGPEVAWVADPGVDQLVRLTPDARERVATVAGVRSANRLSIDLRDGAVWATEPFDGRIRIFTALGAPIATFPALVSPNALAVDAATGTAWVADEVGGSVVRYERTGDVQASAGVFDNPQDVAIGVSTSAWIVDSGVGTVTPVTATGARGTPIALGGDPRRIAVDALDGSLWVTRFGANEVVHLSAAGAVLSRTPIAGGPYAIDLDELRNRVWVGVDLADAVVGLDRASGLEVARVNGIPRPRGLSVADRTGEVWVAAIASGEIVRISSTGTVLVRRGGFDAPFDVRVDPGPREEPVAPGRIADR
jgi:DNA-binding beta-propeller fold protein YncE